MKYFFISFLFITQMCHSQDFILTKLTNEEVNKNIQYHYQWESKDDHVAIVDLFLLKNHRFEYSIASNVNNASSTGVWNSSGRTVTLNSDLQEGTLPIKVSYRQRDSSDLTIKKIDFIRDLRNTPLSFVFVYINNKSIKCYDGDLLCNIDDYKQIDSIKVGLDYNGLSSKWVSIKPNDGLIQITIQTKLNVEKYIILRKKKYQLYKDKLKTFGD